MLKKLIHRLFRRRHYWRKLDFDEVAELYMSRLMTVFAINMVNLFAAIYLYKLGYDLVFIAFFYAAIYVMRMLVAPLAGRYVAYWGPKHGIFVANLLRIPSLLLFLGVEEYGVIMVIGFGVIQQISSCLYDLAYLVDFSKVKHSEHAGKEIGTMQILEKIARVASPVLGGVIASVVSPQAVIIIAAAVFSLAAWPLFRTAEPTPTRYKLELRRVRLRDIWRTFVGEGVVGYDFIASGMAWTLFLAVVVFVSFGDDIYAVVGLLASLSVVASAIGAHAFGRMIDRQRGAVLLTNTVILKAIIHMLRPVAITPPSAVAINFGSEVAATGYGMAFLRVMFDRADSASSRIVYITYMEIAVSLGSTIACIVFGAALLLGGMTAGFASVFVAAAAVQLLMLLSRRYA